MKKLSNSILNYVALGLVLIYRSTLATFLGGNCRFEPSCSCYATEAFSHFDFFSALRLVLLRLSKCRPGGPYGLDPLPKPKRDR